MSRNYKTNAFYRSLYYSEFFDGPELNNDDGNLINRCCLGFQYFEKAKTFLHRNDDDAFRIVK